MDNFDRYRKASAMAWLIGNKLIDYMEESEFMMDLSDEQEDIDLELVNEAIKYYKHIINPLR